ncbi:hypothetical protein, partial [Pseudomonas aeruginosa]|uniref:hypothetical protein n=1 Tax=Pseudomonas aeruginosa TaxID=287 RepID=UPI001E39D5F5
GATPYRNGRVLHSVFAAAFSKRPLQAKNYSFSEYPAHWAAFVSASLIQEHDLQLDRSSADSTSHSPLHYH